MVLFQTPNCKIKLMHSNIAKPFFSNTGNEPEPNNLLSLPGISKKYDIQIYNIILPPIDTSLSMPNIKKKIKNQPL
jgi:hypothetical protein